MCMDVTCAVFVCKSLWEVYCYVLVCCLYVTLSVTVGGVLLCVCM